MKIRIVLYAILFIGISSLNGVFAQTGTAPSSGDGTPGNPYQIFSLNNLVWMSQNPSKMDKHFIQTANIYAIQTTNPTWNFGNGLDTFSTLTGSYDGQGHLIHGLLTSQGFFEEIDGGTLKNLTFWTPKVGDAYSWDDPRGMVAKELKNGGILSNVHVIGTPLDNTIFEMDGYSNMGGLVGIASGGSSIISSSVEGKIRGLDDETFPENIGGLVGILDNSTIRDSHDSVTVYGYQSIGGLVGLMRNGSSISSSSVKDSVHSSTNSQAVGGMVGHMQNGTIDSSYTMVNVSGRNYIGGLAGRVDSGTVSFSFTQGDVTATNGIAGGLVGAYPFSNSTPKSITHSYSLASVSEQGSSKSMAGGLVGEAVNNLTISYSYAVGRVIGNDVGGLVAGSTTPVVENSLYDADSTGASSSKGGVGLLNSAMTDTLTYHYQNWDIHNTWELWAGLNNGYPFFRFMHPNDPPEVSDLTLLGTLHADSILTLNYVYYDPNGDDENGTEIRWYLANDALGTGETLITEATDTTLTLNDGHEGKFFRFEIEPNEGREAGDVQTSAWYGPVIVPRPEISISGLSQDISFGDATPTENDGTYFGKFILDTDSSTSTFKIFNTGLDTLWLGVDAVSLVNNTAGTFEILSQPNTLVLKSDSTSFSIKATPNIDGIFTPIVNIANNDNDESPFTFTLKMEAVEQPFANGFGTEEDPYLITNLEDLEHLYDFLGSHFKLTTDIDLDVAPYNTAPGWAPIGTVSTPFTGSFDGNGHVITGLFHDIHSANYVGLFGYNTGTIKALGVEMEVLFANSKIGGIAGYNNGTITSCYAKGTVQGLSGETGVLVGYNDGTISNSYSQGIVAGSATGSNGGLVGVNNDGEIHDSYSLAEVQTTGAYIGGLSGWHGGSTILGVFSNSYWDTQQSGLEVSAGGTGLETLEMTKQFAYSNWDFTTTWEIRNGSSFPYLQWEGEADSTNFPSNAPPALTSSTNGNNEVTLKWRAPLVEHIEGFRIYRNSVLLNTTSLITDTTFTDLTAQNFSNYSYYVTTVYFDGTEVESNPSISISGSPAPQFTESGTETDPYLVSTFDDLRLISNTDSLWDNHYLQTQDIDATESAIHTDGFLPIAFEDVFTGSYHGGGFSISNLTIDHDSLDGVGLFSVLENATIDSLTLSNLTVHGKEFVGGIAGKTDTSSIKNIRVEGNITAESNSAGGITGVLTKGSLIFQSSTSITLNGQSKLGGIAGELNSSKIQESFSEGVINGSGSTIGGIAGYALGDGEIMNCYSRTQIDGASIHAGIVGESNGLDIIKCYASITSSSNAKGVVSILNAGNITDSYWNLNNGSTPSSSGGTGLTPLEMAQRSSFQNWDFSTIWNINDGISYPTLRNLNATTKNKWTPGQSLAFDGSGDYIEVPDDESLDLTDQFTIEFWIKGSTTDNTVILEKGTANNNFHFQSTNSSGTGGGSYLFFGISIDINFGRVFSQSPVFSDGKWHHIAVTFDDANDLMNLYIDGILDDQNTTATHSPVSNSSPVHIGSRGGNFGIPANIDEVRFWNDIRTQEEIQNNLFQRLTGNEAGLAAYFSFDEKNGYEVTDQTANELVGTFHGDVTNSDDTHPYGTIITGNEGWRMMSASIAGVTYSEILDTLWTQGFTDSDAPEDQPTVYTWNEPTNSFSPLADGSQQVPIGKGFIAYIFDDQDFNGTPDGFPKSLLLEGSSNLGTVSPSLSFTDSGDLPNDGWNLVGNPYGATIDWDAASGLSSANLDASFYVWSDSANAGAGDYLSWNGTTGTFGGGEIAPWQGFWVKANATSPSLSFTDDARSSGGVFLKEAPISQLNLTLTDGTLTSKSLLMFSDHASIEKDVLDAYKLESLNPKYLSLFTELSDGAGLDINALPLELENALEIPLGMEGSNLSGDFKLEWNPANLPDEMNIILLDTETGAEIDLEETSSFSFNIGKQAKVVQDRNKEPTPPKTQPKHGIFAVKVVKAKSSESTPRFVIKINYGTSVSTEPVADLPTVVELDQNYPNPFNPSTNIAFGLPTSGNVTLEVYDILGRRVATLLRKQNRKAGRHTINFDASSLSSGMYIYRLQAGNSVITKKLTLIK